MSELTDVGALFPTHHEITRDDIELDARMRQRDERERAAARSKELALLFAAEGAGVVMPASVPNVPGGEING